MGKSVSFWIRWVDVALDGVVMNFSFEISKYRGSSNSSNSLLSSASELDLEIGLEELECAAHLFAD